VRSALRRQPAIPSFGQASRETRKRPRNPGFSLAPPPSTTTLGSLLGHFTGGEAFGLSLYSEKLFAETRQRFSGFKNRRQYGP
jgi:hypothetical protein